MYSVSKLNFDAPSRKDLNIRGSYQGRGGALQVQRRTFWPGHSGGGIDQSSCGKRASGLSGVQGHICVQEESMAQGSQLPPPHSSLFLPHSLSVRWDDKHAFRLGNDYTLRGIKGITSFPSLSNHPLHTERRTPKTYTFINKHKITGPVSLESPDSYDDL